MVDSSNDVLVQGVDVDPQTRCAHWHSPLDIIAIKFRCCGEWYACYECHRELADHPSAVWPQAEFGEKAILCGACRTFLDIATYLSCGFRCPDCGSDLNPGCALHRHLYFADDNGPIPC